MSKIPPVTLVFGDRYMSQNVISAAKKKFVDYKFDTVSASKSTHDDIRADIGTYDWTEDKKVIVIEDFPNNIDTRKFLLDICQNIPEDRSVILFDTLNSIKVDPKTHKPSKSWQQFVQDIKTIEGAMVINNGPKYTIKDGADCISFIKKVFQKYNKTIDERDAKLLMKLVGMDKGILISEIGKMALTCPDHIGSDFILENAFCVTQEAVLYKFSNALDSCSPNKVLGSIEEFMHMGVHPNVLAEIMMKKARWQLAAAYFYSQKIPWNIIVSRLMEMGEFPSFIWHEPNKTMSEKRACAEHYQDAEGIVEYMRSKQGIPAKYFKNKIKKTKTLKSGKISKAKEKAPKGKTEKIPLRFMASQVTSFLRDHVIRNNGSHPNLAEGVLNRGTKVYLFLHEKLVEVRTSNNPSECLTEMALALIDTKI